LEEAWQGFGHYDATLDREWQQSLRPFRDALRGVGRAYFGAEDPTAAAEIFFRCPGSLRFFVLNGHGILEQPSLVNPGRRRKLNPSLKPLHPEIGGNWSRCSYFKQAIKNIGKIVIVGPHYSLTDGQGCYTAALAAETSAGVVVLCGDFELPEEHSSMQSTELGQRALVASGPGEFDASGSVIEIGSATPRLREL
jgi:hypothetical protein